IEYFCPIEWRQTKYDPTVNTIRGSSRATSNIKTEPLGYVPEKPLTEYEQKFVVFEYNRSNIGTIGQGSLIKCSLYLYNNSILGIFWLFSFVKSALFLVLENKMKNYFLCGGGVQYVHFANYNSRSSNSSRK
ncbi:MAG TPA: hypothetical protein VFV86_00560, partial [Nitrososphaeraceae archaeon]|nr:hypothetical protein [Nitrososphaeraceae archaeon]